MTDGLFKDQSVFSSTANITQRNEFVNNIFKIFKKVIKKY